MTRKLAGFGLAFALAELAAAYLPPLASLLTAALFISLFLFAAFTQRRAARFALPAVAGLLAGLVWSAAYQLAVVKPAQSLAGQTYACTAIVQPDAETSWQPGNVRATLLITQLDGRKTSLKVYCTDLPYSEAGNIITGQFQLQPLRADSYRMSRYAKGTWLGASYQADYIWQGTSDALPYRLYHLRQAFAKRLTTYLPQNLAGVEAAMLLGEKSELTDEWSDTFRTAGIAHLLAVSGLHVALLCGLFAMGQGRRSRFSVPRVLLQITVLLLYMGLTGLPFSVFRAGVMFLIMLVGSLLLQPPDSLTALALAAIIIGVQQPFAPCDIGFQLSVCGVLGVLAASALAKRQTQFVQVRYAARHNQRRQTALPLPLAIVLRAVDAVQTAVLATLATLPVLLLHGMAASGAAVPANLLVVWLLGPALRLGILALVLSFVPVLDPLFHGASLLLGIVLRLMTTLAAWCAALPVAHIALPVRYTLWVLAVFAVLAALFWRTRQLRRFVPVGFVCAVAAVMLGSTMQRDVVRLAMVGTAGNGCVVAVQNNRAVVLYRGSAANGRAVQQYLTQNGAPELAAVIDLRTEPGEMPLQAAQLLTIADLPQSLTHLQLLDTVEVDLLHTNAAALAVLDVGGWHAAASAGKLILAGMAVSSVCSAIGNFAIYIVNNKNATSEIMFWTMGSLAGAKWQRVGVLLPVVFIGTLIFWSQFRNLNLMLLGDEASITLGTDLHRARNLYMILSSLMVGFAVYAAGTIGFVGLIVPHAVRMIFGTDHRRLVPLCALVGAIFLIWADVGCRVILKNSEMPIGILVSIIGAPCFIYLMVRRSYGFGGGRG